MEDNKSVNKRGLAKWIEDFAVAFEKLTSGERTASVQASNEGDEGEKLAEINIHDLDRVVWHDETFYVHFVNDGARIINAFGNIVTFLPNVNTIEDVDKKLNGDEIVTASDEEGRENQTDSVGDDLQNELDRIARSLTMDEGGVTNEVEGDEVEGTGESPNVTSGTERESNSDMGLNDKVVDAIIDGFEELEDKINELNRRLSSLERRYVRDRRLDNVEITGTSEEKTRDETHVPNNGQDAYLNESQGDAEQNVPNRNRIKLDWEQDYLRDHFHKLEGRDERIFQRGVCPVTGEELVKSSKIVNNFLGVYSPKGGTEYAVNLETGEIFRYLGG